MQNERRISFEIHRTDRLIKRLLDNGKNKPYVEKITGNHGHIIGFIYANKEKNIYQKDIEKRFHIRPSTATNMLKLMEKNGLIIRTADEHDSRLKKITLTKKAIDVQQIVVEDFESFDQKIKNGISEQELAQFYAVLDKINRNLKEDDICD